MNRHSVEGSRGNMNLVKRALHDTFVYSVKAYQRLCLDLRVWGREKIPPGHHEFCGTRTARPLQLFSEVGWSYGLGCSF